MNKTFLKLMDRVTTASSLEEAKAFAQAAMIALDPEEPISRRVELLSVQSGKEIQVIKALREVLHLGLKEAKDMVESTPVVVGTLELAQAQTLRNSILAAGGDAIVC